MEQYIPFLIFPLALGFLALTPLILHFSKLKAQENSLKRKHHAIFEEVVEQKDHSIHMLRHNNQRYQEHLILAEKSLRLARPYQITAENMQNALEEMQEVWLNDESLEEDCRIVLEKTFGSYGPITICIQKKSIGNEI